MDNLNQEIKPIIIPKSFIDYHCLKCGEIPLLHFTHYNINLICSTHKILNIPIDKIFNYINTDYECSICQQNIKCKVHNKIYDKYCFKCKLNLCELCEIHKDHYEDVYPLDEDINNFYETKIIVLDDLGKDRKIK